MFKSAPVNPYDELVGELIVAVVDVAIHDSWTSFGGAWTGTSAVADLIHLTI